MKGDNWNTMKKGVLQGAGFAAGALMLGALSLLFAQSLNTFSSGQTVSASAINTNFQIAAPEGAVMAFYLDACPSGWIVADGSNGTPDLRGVFVRGRDPGNATGRDVDGARTIGSFQNDAFQGHRHDPSPAGWNYQIHRTGSGASGNGAGSDLSTGSETGDARAGVNGTPRTANETRPRNVALTYCMRKDT